MKWLLLVPAVFVVAILVLLIFGLFQPVKHSVTRSVHLKLKPENVFAVLDQPDWSTTVAKVERLPDRNGKPTARYTLRWGGMQMIVTQLERTPPTRLVLGMAKENGFALGKWTYELVEEEGGCRVALTEDGELKNPFFRAMARIRGLDTNITQTLRDLAKKFGDSAEIRAGR